jgi:Uma2 family endonuclease
MLKYVEPLDWLPTAEELLDSDETPVDNELQELVPTLLKLILAMAWVDRADWFMGIDMGIYYSPDEPPIVPDAFLSIGVESVKSEDLRSSYVLWEEDGVLPLFALEVVSKKYRGEYSTKKVLYEQLGVLYYAVYNARRRRKPTLEVYKLINGAYLPMVGNPIWMPELGLGLGKEIGIFHSRRREWLFWYDVNGDRYLMPDERIKQEKARVEEQRQRAEEQQRRVDAEKIRAEAQAQRATQAEVRANQAESKAQQAESKAQQAESKAQQAESKAQQAESKAQQAESKAQKLADYLRRLGIDPDAIQ